MPVSKSRFMLGKLKEGLLEHMKGIVTKDQIKINYKFVEEEGIKSPECDLLIELYKDLFIFLELENYQPHPDTNFIKYWRWIDQYKRKEKIVLIQVFGPQFAKENYISRIRNIDFLVKMNIPFEYHRLGYSNKWGQQEFDLFGDEVQREMLNDIKDIIEKYRVATGQE